MDKSTIVLSLLLLLGSNAQAQPRMGGMPPHFPEMMAERMRAMDTDQDQLISRQEFLDFHAQKFERLDRNRDGFLDKSEQAPPFPPGHPGFRGEPGMGRGGGPAGMPGMRRQEAGEPESLGE